MAIANGKYVPNMAISGDSFIILPTFEDNSVDLILTDVPYDLTPMEKLFLHQHFIRISNGCVIVFSPPENQWVLPADQYLFWIKSISTKNTSRRYSRFVEMIFVYGGEKWDSGRHWSQYTNVFMDLVDDTSLHQYRKPPSLIERLIRNHTNKGDLTLDPFAGSGVVGDVAERLERRYLLIDKDY